MNLVALLVCQAALLLASVAYAADSSFPMLRKVGHAFLVGNELARRSGGAASIEQQIRAQADVQIDHFEGVPATGKPIKIYFETYTHKNEYRGAIVISSGRTEGAALYKEVILDFLLNGFSVYIFDHRGQGYSTRLIPNPADSSKGHIDDFDKYVADFSSFVRIVGERRASKGPIYVVAHSMGGAIAAIALEQHKANFVTKAAFVTPMFEPWVAGEEATIKSKAQQYLCNKLALQIPFEVPVLSERFAEGDTFDRMYARYLVNPDPNASLLTSSAWRLQANWAARASTCTGEHCGNRDAKIGGPTLRWFLQACSASRKARGPDAMLIDIPVLVLQGEHDTVVNPAAQIQFCNAVNKSLRPGASCLGERIANAKHAALIERDEIRSATLRSVMDFLTKPTLFAPEQ